MKLFTLTAVNTFTKCVYSKNAAISFLTGLFLLVATVAVNAQAVSGIVTDYNGYWKTTAATPNAVKPSNSHNLLSFTYNGTQYSTGVNDPLLTLNGESFVPGDFWSLPYANLTGTITSNTKVGIGEMYDGVHNGAGTVPSNPLSSYLSDGIKGLDIGTCIANLPAGNLVFDVANIQPSKIGDGIPDILVTQVADPSGSLDKYSFTDINGNIIGNTKDIVFTNITPVGKWTADFYEAANTPRNLTGGFTNTDRDIRLWAADLSDFGITAANYSQIKRFVVALSGNSDVAFAAYNNRTFFISSTLPVKLGDFAVAALNGHSELTWKTETESNSGQFIVERSENNQNYTAIANVAAAGKSVSTKSYSFTDLHPKTGVNYYRLKMIDMDGTVTYSNIVSVRFDAATASISLYPNPATSEVYVNHPAASGKEVVSVYNAAGNTMLQSAIARSSTQTKLDLRNLPKGIYYINWQTETGKHGQSLVIR